MNCPGNGAAPKLELVSHLAEWGEGRQQDFDQAFEHEIKAAAYIPKSLSNALAMNPLMEATFWKIVPEVVRLSFFHPDTSMRVMTAQAIQERTEIVLQVLDALYNGRQFSLHQSYDMLLDVTIKAIRESRKPHVLADEPSLTPGRWVKGDIKE